MYGTVIGVGCMFRVYLPSLPQVLTTQLSQKERMA